MDASKLVGHAVWLVLMGLVMGWLARSRARTAPQGGETVLRNPGSVMAVGVVCALFFVACAVLSHLFPGKTGTPAISLSFLGFSLLGFYLMAECARVSVKLETGGLRYTGLLHGPRFLPWVEVKRVDYSESWKCFRLEGADGRTLTVSALLVGLPSLAKEILAKIPAEFIDEASRPVLEKTAAGDLPPIWQ